MQSYDELEAQYYILTQRNAELEKQNNSLALRNLELETEIVGLEGSVRRAENKNSSLAGEVQNEVCKRINLEITIDELREKINKHNVVLAGQVNQTILADAEELQAFRNHKTFVDLPKYSINKPMSQWALSPSEIMAPKQIVLSAIDMMTAYKDVNIHDIHPRYHVVAQCNGKVVRYSQESFLSLDRMEDFAVVVNQMCDGLKYELAKEYSKGKFIW